MVGGTITRSALPSPASGVLRESVDAEVLGVGVCARTGVGAASLVVDAGVEDADVEDGMAAAGVRGGVEAAGTTGWDGTTGVGVVGVSFGRRAGAGSTGSTGVRGVSTIVAERR